MEQDICFKECEDVKLFGKPHLQDADSIAEQIKSLMIRLKSLQNEGIMNSSPINFLNPYESWIHSPSARSSTQVQVL